MSQEAEYQTERLDHLGIVAGVCREAGIAEWLDKQAGERSYQVTGIDRDEVDIIEARGRAREAGQHIVYLVRDMLQLDDLPGTFDAVISMWQSLCYFDEETNVALLRSICHKLTSGGRFVVDLYNRDYFEHHQGETCRRLMA